MFDVQAILEAGGLLILGLIIFAECGLLLGFFLPGDTLLIAAGLLASANPESFPIALAVPVAFVAAVAGYQVGYVIGERAGPKLFTRHEGILLRQDYISRTQAFMAKHGGKALILARYVAIVRTVIPLIAGIGGMNKRRFFIYNIIGALLWTTGLTLAAYWLGNQVPKLEKYIAPLILLGVAVTLVSVLGQFARIPARRRVLKQALREEWNHLFGKK